MGGKKRIDEKEIKGFGKGSKDDPFGLQIFWFLFTKDWQNRTQYSFMRIESCEGTQQYCNFIYLRIWIQLLNSEPGEKSVCFLKYQNIQSRMDKETVQISHLGF